MSWERNVRPLLPGAGLVVCWCLSCAEVRGHVLCVVWLLMTLSHGSPSGPQGGGRLIPAPPAILLLRCS